MNTEEHGKGFGPEWLDGLVDDQAFSNKAGRRKAGGRGPGGGEDTGGDEERFTITPKGILAAAVSEAYGIPLEKLLDGIDGVAKALLKGLSALATGGKDPDLLGSDFNDFFHMYVKAINEVGRMRQLLVDNGIDWRGGEDDDGGEDEEYEGGEYGCRD